MKIVKIGEKTWRNAVIRQIRRSIFIPPMFFTVQLQYSRKFKKTILLECNDALCYIRR